MDLFAVIADPVRRQVVELLHGRPLPAGRIAEAFADISRPAVSRHLRVLREVGLVEAELVGRERIYRCRPEALDEVRGWLDRVGPDADAAAWDRRFDALETEVHRTRRQRERTGRRAPAADAPHHEETA